MDHPFQKERNPDAKHVNKVIDERKSRKNISDRPEFTPKKKVKTEKIDTKRKNYVMLRFSGI